MHHLTWFYMDSQNPNKSPHGCVVGILHNELSPRPFIQLFDFEGRVIWKCQFYVTFPVNFLFNIASRRFQVHIAIFNSLLLHE